jgi:dienelactone hydrolase
MIRFAILLVALSQLAAAGEPLPKTAPLTEEGDLAAKMVAGIHKYLDRELAAAPAKRWELWKTEFDSKEALVKSLPAKRERLRKILGVVDERVKPNLEYIAGPGKPSLLAQIDGCQIHAVRWAVLPGIDAEGLLIEPKENPRASAVAVPHADQLPEELAGLAKGDDYALRLARGGCRVLIPYILDRTNELSQNPRLKKQTNIPHREFIYRMAYELGRTLTGYEVQKVLAAVDWLAIQKGFIDSGEFASEQNRKLMEIGVKHPPKRIDVIGYGDGGMIALYAGALDTRISATLTAGYFNGRSRIFEEPIDRNLFGSLREFGDAEVAALIYPRQFTPELHMEPPRWSGPVERTSKSAAPGMLGPIHDDALEEHRYHSIFDPKLHDEVIILGGGFIRPKMPVGNDRDHDRVPAPREFDPAPRHNRQFDQLVAFNQKLWRNSDAARKEFWKKADASSPAAWEKSCDWYREYFHSEVIGKLPEPTMPLNPRTRQVYDEKDFTGYEVMLDVYPDVFAEGILLLPKDLKPSERRPVVVCQHGLEGTPRKCIDIEKGPNYFEFARKLVGKGYIVYCPQNPYYGGNIFRQIQRKANPLGLSLFSFIVRQHQRTLDWLESLPNVDAKRIAFYGLSYGGKTAMRVPAIEKRYCLSICSGDFNEWIGKNVSVDLDRSYMWSGEYEMYEFNLGHTFNYAEMAYLIAPRPFMVERGHDDGVGTDDMVASEYAKVRYLYVKLKSPERTDIDFQPGGHQIYLKGSLDFLTKHLGLPKQ